MKELKIKFSRKDELEALAGSLEKRNLYDDSFLYTVVDGARIDRVKETGTYRNNDNVFAYQKVQLTGDMSEAGSFEEKLLHYESPAVVIWKPSVLERFPNGHNNNAIDSLYRFVDPKNKVAAIKAIVHIEMEQGWKLSDSFDAYR